jgi:predicted Zn finger-like uncharacterized protein
MKIVCESCSAKYSIADEKVAGRVFKIRCKKCGSAIVVRGDQVDEAGGAAPAGGEEAPTRVVDYGGEAVWHLVVDGEQQGPYAPAQLGEMLSAGTMAWDTFVWREGFDDWKAAQDIEDLVQAIMGGGGAGGPGEVSADPFAATGTPSSRPAAVAARAPDGGRDLFAAQESASPFGGGGEDDDGVVASAPAPRVSAEQSLTGARNENSVLFSLSNLQALATGGSGGSAPASSSSASSPIASAAPSPGGGPRPGHATGEGSGLIDIRALAGASGGGGGGGLGAPSAPKADRVDDLLSIGGAGSAGLGLGSSLGAPVLVPEKKEESNKGMIIGIAAAAAVALVAIAAAVVVVVVVNDDDGETPVAAAGSLNTGQTVNPNAQAAQTGQPGVGTPNPSDGQPPPGQQQQQQGEAPTAQEANVAAGEQADSDERTTGRPRNPNARRDQPAGQPQAPAQAERPSRDSNPSSERATGGGDIDDLLNDALGEGRSNPRPARQPREEAPAQQTGGTGPQAPSRGDVVSALNGVQGAVSACGNGTHGTANVRIVFAGRTGAATNATVQGGNFPAPVMSCIARAARNARVPPFQQPTFSVNYPFRL